MLKKILLVVVIVIAAILIFAATRPNMFRVERSTVINASPDKIFPLVDDFHSWPQWSPYEHLDPSMKRTYSGAEKGKGAAYQWEGNSSVGAGRMEIIDTTSPAATTTPLPSRVVMKLDFTKPLAGHNTAEFTMAPQGSTTRVTWAMYGVRPYHMKVMGMFVNMDRMIGDDFAKGLANLKTVAEK